MVKPTDLTSPIETIVDLFVANWNAANCPNAGTPNFATEWITKTRKGTPLVTVTNREDAKTAGGSGYSSIRGDGSGANQRKAGFVLLNVWAEAEYDPSSEPNPKTLREEIWNECERIILENFSGVASLEVLSLSGPSEETVEEGGTVVVRGFGRVEYEYTLTPV